MDTILEQILAGRVVEFSYGGERYLIQQENNKGWDYISLWRLTPPSACLNRVFFDIFDGISEETVRELLSQTCLDGHTLREILESPEGADGKENHG